MKVNGKTIPLDAEMTVHSLLMQLKLDTKRVAVERNGQIVPRARFVDQALGEDDVLELVEFVGGG